MFLGVCYLLSRILREGFIKSPYECKPGLAVSVVETIVTLDAIVSELVLVLLNNLVSIYDVSVMMSLDLTEALLATFSLQFLGLINKWVKERSCVRIRFSGVNLDI